MYFAAQNVGIDQLSLGELAADGSSPQLTDGELAARKDVEWYRLYMVRGRPTQLGRMVDRDRPVT